MKQYIYQWVCLAILGMLSTSLSAQNDFSTTLSGSQQVLPIATTAQGSASATLDGSRLSVSGSFENLSSAVATDIAGGAHIHVGYAGQNGPVVFPLTLTLSADSLSGSFEDTFELTDEQIETLQGREMYINLHTEQYRGGEIRGQIIPSDANGYFTNLFGSYEVPVVMSSGSGALSIDLVGNTLTVAGSFMNLEGDFDASIGGGAHLHIGLAGQNGPVEIALNANTMDDLSSGIFEAADNTFELSDGQIDLLQDRNMYANIHTTRNPSGEIRGQVTPTANIRFRAHLNGSTGIPVVTTLASGMVVAELQGNQLIVSGRFDGLESDFATEIGAHIHLGMAGMAGPVIFPLTVDLDDDLRGASISAASNTFDLDEDGVAAIINRRYYINVHTLDNPAGEIRGQLVPESQLNFNGFLSGIFQSPSLASRATGGIKAELNGNQLTVSGSFENLSSEVDTNIAGGAHLHLGMAGMNGPIAIILTINLSENGTSGTLPASENTYELTDEQVMTMRQRGIYANIHTLNFPSGEVRAQILPEATAYFTAPLSGASATNSVNTAGTGMVIVEINGTTAFVSGAFRELAGDFDASIAGGSHIHTAYAGSNGPIVIDLNADTEDDLTNGTFPVGDNTFMQLTEGLIDSMRQRLHYVNIHTTEVPSGEIRGQLLPLATAYFTTSLDGFNQVPPVRTAAFGGSKVEYNDGELTLTGSFNDLEGDYDANIGSHLHIAMPGMNGPVDIVLVPNLADDLRSGVYSATENTYTLEDNQVDVLFAQNYYQNIHTLAHPNGELRGQILSEINFFPSNAPTIVSPENGAMVTVEGNTDDAFVATWTSAMDADKVVYVWQLATSDSFETILFESYVGSDSMFTATLGTIDTLLADNGLAIGDDITLFHRAIASDGSVYVEGEAASVTLVRGEVGDEDDGENDGVDLELTADIDNNQYQQFTNVSIDLTVTNTGTETATNVVVTAGLIEGLVYTSFTSSKGVYRPVVGNWEIDELMAGESATLSLVLFVLVEDENLVYFAEIISQDQGDNDSTPNSGDTGEDDEVMITLVPFSEGGVGTGDGTADISISISTEDNTFEQFIAEPFTITVMNDGPDAATNLFIDAKIPAGMAFTSADASAGSYNNFFQRWEVGRLESGASATLELVLFPLVQTDLTFFAQVFSVNQNDPDSTPNNSNGMVNEDDEASVTLTLDTDDANAIEQRNLTVTRTYPVPAQTQLTLELESGSTQTGIFFIRNVQGQVVKQVQLGLTKGFNNVSIDINNLSSGFYWIESDRLETPQQFIKAQ